MTFSRQALMRGVLGGGVALLSTGVLVYAQFNPQPDPPGHYFGMMTVAVQHDISIHVANIASAVDTFRPERSLCSARLEVVNACGEVLARSTARIAPGASRSLNFTVPTPDQLPPGPCADPPGAITGGDVAADPPGAFDPPAPIRGMRLRAQVIFAGGASHCISSVEVGDPFSGEHGTGGGGGSGFIHPGLIVGFNPQPDPPGQTGKLLR